MYVNEPVIQSNTIHTLHIICDGRICMTEKDAQRRRVLELWRATDSVENRTGPDAERDAGDVCDALLGFLGDAPLQRLERDIHGWLQGVMREDRWRLGRRNRALPYRVALAVLTVVGHPAASTLLPENFGRALSGVQLGLWLRELHAIPGRAPRPAEDPQWLWNAYAWELEHQQRQGGAVHNTTVRSRREKLRRWRLHVAPHALVRDGGPDEPPLPDAFRNPEFATLDPYLRFFAAVRWADAEDVLRLLRGLATSAERCRDRRRGRVLAAYVRPFYHLCRAILPTSFPAASGTTTTITGLLPTLRGLSREALIEAVAQAPEPIVDPGRCLRLLYQFTQGGPWGPAFLRPWSAWPAITARELGFHPSKRLRSRDRFTDEEVNRLRAFAEAQGPFHHGLLCFLLPYGPGVHAHTRAIASPSLHTGCRSGAASSLRVDDVMDVPLGAMRRVGRVAEKGGVWREFDVDPLLSRALLGAIGCNRGSPLPPVGGLDAHTHTPSFFSTVSSRTQDADRADRRPTSSLRTAVSAEDRRARTTRGCAVSANRAASWAATCTCTPCAPHGSPLQCNLPNQKKKQPCSPGAPSSPCCWTPGTPLRTSHSGSGIAPWR